MCEWLPQETGSGSAAGELVLAAVAAGAPVGPTNTSDNYVVHWGFQTSHLLAELVAVVAALVGTEPEPQFAAEPQQDWLFCPSCLSSWPFAVAVAAGPAAAAVVVLGLSAAAGVWQP